MAVEKAQGLPGVPPYTTAQKEAIEVYRATVDECAQDIDFHPGDVQFLNNFVCSTPAASTRTGPSHRASAICCACAKRSDRDLQRTGVGAGPLFCHPLSKSARRAE